VLAAVLFAASAVAQSGGATGSAGSTGTSPSTSTATTAAGGGDSKSQLARADRGFLEQAAQNGHAEVESSKLALTKAQSAEVKAFAQKMVDDHTKANSELAALASSKGFEAPKEPSLMQKAKMKLLSASDGENFDKRYADTMGVQAHQDTLELFRKGSAEATDPDVKAFASKTIPALEHHLKMAQQLKQSVEASTSADASRSTGGTGTASGTGSGGTGTSAGGQR
jgi:putative membrane protein